MANPHRGEVWLWVGGQVYTIRLSTNALVEAETLLGQGIGEISEALSDPKTMRLGTVRALLWAGMHEAQPKLSLLEVGDLIGAVGISEAIAKLGEAMQAAFPPPQAEAENPQQASPDGTGQPS